VAVDPLFPDQIEQWCQQNGKALKVILITHEHHDHVHGLEELQSKFSTEVWAHPTMKSHLKKIDRYLEDGDIVKAHNFELKILHTPGHTPTHICLLFSEKGEQREFIAMDTVFNAGVGHCKLGGDPKVLYKTICRISKEVEDQVLLHPGHDYIEKNLSFTLEREPDNKKASELFQRIEKEGSLNIVTTMGMEKEVNVFFRTHSQSIRENLPQDTTTEEEVFINLRKLRDNF
jgi:hydroxyacylglutathione hydrolase